MPSWSPCFPEAMDIASVPQAAETYCSFIEVLGPVLLGMLDETLKGIGRLAEDVALAGNVYFSGANNALDFVLSMGVGIMLASSETSDHYRFERYVYPFFGGHHVSIVTEADWVDFFEQEARLALFVVRSDASECLAARGCEGHVFEALRQRIKIVQNRRYAAVRSAPAGNRRLRDIVGAKAPEALQRFWETIYEEALIIAPEQALPLLERWEERIPNRAHPQRQRIMQAIKKYELVGSGARWR